VEKPIAPKPLAEKALRLFAERANQAGLDIRLRAGPDLPLLLADERLVKQALLNLISNSVKFTPSGGRIEVRLSLDAEGGLRISVRDSGTGISERDFERVLSPFGQVENVLGREIRGTGLGLPLAKSFVELHGGVLELRSVLGEGTDVAMRFPARRSQCPEASGEANVLEALSA